MVRCTIHVCLLHNFFKFTLALKFVFVDYAKLSEYASTCNLSYKMWHVSLLTTILAQSVGNMCNNLTGTKNLRETYCFYMLCSYSLKAIPRGKWTDERRYPFEGWKLTKNRIPVYETKPITTLYHSLNPQTARDRMTLSTRDFTTVEFRHVARFLKKRYKRSYCCFAEWITSFPLWPAAMGVV